MRDCLYISSNIAIKYLYRLKVIKSKTLKLFIIHSSFMLFFSLKDDEIWPSLDKHLVSEMTPQAACVVNRMHFVYVLDCVVCLSFHLFDIFNSFQGRHRSCSASQVTFTKIPINQFLFLKCQPFPVMALCFVVLIYLNVFSIYPPYSSELVVKIVFIFRPLLLQNKHF